MSAAEVLNPRTLIPCKKNSVWKQVENQTPRICRFNGELVYAQYTGETKREHTGNSIQNNNQSIHRMCSVSTFIQVHTNWQKYWHVLQCSLLSSTLTPKIYSYTEYLSNGLAVYAPLRLLVTHRFAYRFTHSFYAPVRPNRSVPTDPVFGLHSRSDQCWACISTTMKR